MAQGQSRVVSPGQQNGLPSTEQMLLALAEQAEWPAVSEWVVLESARMIVVKAADGSRVLQFWTQGNRRGYRLPMPPLTAAVIARDLGSGLAVVPASDEVADASAPVDEPPAPPMMGQ